jgi:uncharacterized membrane protein
MTPNKSRNKRFALGANLFLLRITRHWLRIAITILSIYVTLPIVAPTLMHLGLTGPGQFLYTLYSPFCHQFAFRSFFLYGEQPYYPREITNLQVKPFEDYAIESQQYLDSYNYYYARSHNGTPPETVTRADLEVFSPWMQFAARDFPGNPQMGYKTTLCERDMAIYISLLIGAIIFTRIRHRLRPVPIILYVILGLGPIALDGVSQLLGYPPFNLWPQRETTPLFRVVTGALFGLMNAWLGLPYLEISMRETREDIEEKLHRAGIEI